MRKLNTAKKQSSKDIEAARSLERMILKYVSQEKYREAFREMADAFWAAYKELGDSAEGLNFRKLYDVVQY
jgi:hypothetical protein